MRRMDWRRPLQTLALGTAVILIAAGCTAGGPVTYEEAEELREQISAMEDRLSDVESMLVDAQNGELPENAQGTLEDAEGEVAAVLTSLGEIRDALVTPEPAGEVPPPQPAPGAGGTSM